MDIHTWYCSIMCHKDVQILSRTNQRNDDRCFFKPFKKQENVIIMQEGIVRMIKVKNITKFYGTNDNRFQVLKGISLEIKDGDFITILSASGSGKSTFLNTISGLEHPDSGSVLYDAKDITALSDTELTTFRKETVGFIFQQYYLLPNMTVAKNVKMGTDLAGNKNYKAILEAVGLDKKQHKYPSELSGGEQQRVSVARALAKNPKVLFLDEPTEALDEQAGRQVLDCICKLQKT